MALKSLKIGGYILIILGLFIPLSYVGGNKVMQALNTKEVEKAQTQNTYYGILEIPKINFKRQFYAIDSPQNNVNKNINLLKGSIMPKEGNISNIIIAGHSGWGLKAFFKDLYKLKEGDIAKVYYNNYLYTYSLIALEIQDKTGVLYLKSYPQDMLTLITCTKNNDKTQDIYYAQLINKEIINVS